MSNMEATKADEPVMTVDECGTKLWRLNGVLHRIDGPAVETTYGSRFWLQNGVVHRVGGPAHETSDGSRFWYENGRMHRADGPAIEWANGKKSWFTRGQEFQTEDEMRSAVPLAEDGKFTLYRCGSLYVAGCRRFTLEEARAHWPGKSNRQPFVEALAKESLARDASDTSEKD